MRKVFTALLGVAMMFAAAPALAQDELCEGQPWLSECATNEYAERLKAFGQPSLQLLHGQHRRVLRAFYEGLGDSLPAIALEQLPSGAGRLSVVAVLADGPYRYRPLTSHMERRRVVREAMLSRAETTHLFAEAPVVFDSPVIEADMPDIPDKSGLHSLCVDPDGARVEVVDALGIVSRNRSNCEQSPIWNLARRLAKVAALALPPCDRVAAGRARYRRLQNCARLSGNLQAAADVYDVDWSGQYGDKDVAATRSALMELLAPSATLEIAGGVGARDKASFVDAWSAFRATSRVTGVWTDTVEGLGADAVRTRGGLEFPSDGQHDLTSPYEVLWRLGPDRRWRIERLTIGPRGFERQ